MVRLIKVIFQVLFFAGLVPAVNCQDKYQLLNRTDRKEIEKPAAVISEAIFLHTDREEYIAGENCWFTAYLVETGKGAGSAVSSFAYIELLNAERNPVVQKGISLFERSGHGMFVMPDTLSSGSYILRAYTNLMKNLPPENCFMKIITIYNSLKHRDYHEIISVGQYKDRMSEASSSPYTISGDELSQIFSVRAPDSTAKREKITLDITAGRNAVRSAVITNLSISVAPWTGRMEETYVHNTSSREPVSYSPSAQEYKAEITGRIIHGSLLSQNTGEDLADRIILLSVPGKEAYFRYAITDGNGKFTFNIHKDENPAELVIQQLNKDNNNLIRIESSFWDRYPDIEIRDDSLYREIPQYISDWSENYQVSKIYGISHSGDPLPTQKMKDKKPRFYGVPDMELLMADYVLLPSMQEVFYELIPGVSMKTGRKNYGITVVNPLENRQYEEEPTLMIDGVIINESSLMVEMSTEKVERIDVMRNEYVSGGYHFYGIVNLITKTGDFSNLPLPENSIRFPYAVTDQEEIPFTAPDYSDPAVKISRVPDFRNTLYWNPSLKPDSEGSVKAEFWSSDMVSDYLITIYGITGSGKIISQKKLIKVR